MATSSQHPTRPALQIEPICPPWCMGHNDSGFLSWHIMTATGQSERHHDGPDNGAAGIGVTVVQKEHEGGRLGEPSVWIFPDDMAPEHNLTPDEADQLAACLVAAAQTIRSGHKAAA